ncbi:protein of unknown function [Ruminococcaceae bacterium BL-6]|nr:protein of unknown function [Ruminococcaceae bacterium BL-6]
MAQRLLYYVDIEHAPIESAALRQGIVKGESLLWQWKTFISWAPSAQP